MKHFGPVDGHYAYCKDTECAGCLPTDDSLASFAMIDLWTEMLARCIAQTPQTKTKHGALNALLGERYNGAHWGLGEGLTYRELSAAIRSRRVRIKAAVTSYDTCDQPEAT